MPSTSRSVLIARSASDDWQKTAASSPMLETIRGEVLRAEGCSRSWRMKSNSFIEFATETQRHGKKLIINQPGELMISSELRVGLSLAFFDSLRLCLRLCAPVALWQNL